LLYAIHWFVSYVLAVGVLGYSATYPEYFDDKPADEERKKEL